MQRQKKNAQSAIIFLLESTVFYLRFEGRGLGRKGYWEGKDIVGIVACT